MYKYLDGKLKEFSVPYEMEGTQFQKKVWSALATLEFGRTISYAQLALRCGEQTKYSRAVASAVARNKLPILIPCHRIVGSGGKLGGFGPGIDTKIALLQLERSMFNSTNRQAVIYSSGDCYRLSKFPHKGSCYSLGSKGPCPPAHTFLLNSTAVNFQAICSPDKCELSNQVWWVEGEIGACIPREEAKNKCSKERGEQLSRDLYGDWYCACAPFKTKVHNHKDCYEPYSRGPCDSGHVVSPVEGSDVAECSIDKCEGRGVPLRGRGQCFRLGGAEPCASVDAQSRLVLNDALLPDCSRPDLGLHLVDAPPLCKADDSGRCLSAVEADRIDRKAYLILLKRQRKTNRHTHL